MVVSGVAVAGPVCPVETTPPDPACAAEPVAGARLIVIDLNGAEVASAVTGADGAFELHVAPGTYSLISQPVEGLMGVAQPQEFTVGETPVEITLSYDTGIR